MDLREAGVHRPCSESRAMAVLSVWALLPQRLLPLFTQVVSVMVRYLDAQVIFFVSLKRTLKFICV